MTYVGMFKGKRINSAFGSKNLVNFQHSRRQDGITGGGGWAVISIPWGGGTTYNAQ